MSERDPEVSAHVDAFRDDVQMPVDVDAAWARFAASVEGDRPAAAIRGPRGPMVWVAAAAVLAAAAVVVWAVGTGQVLRGAEDEPGQQASDRALGAAGRPTTTPQPPAPSDPVRASAGPESQDAGALPAPRVEGVENTRPTRPPAAKKAAKPTAKTRSSRLAEELELLESMRSASSAGRHAEALRLVRKHAASFGEGAFSAERELTRVRALCGLGRTRETRQAKARFAKIHADSHLAAQVQKLCAEPARSTDSDHDAG